MIEREGIHICKNPECGEEFAWSAFLRIPQRDGQNIITVSSKCPYCGTAQKWIQIIENERAGNELCG